MLLENNVLTFLSYSVNYSLFIPVAYIRTKELMLCLADFVLEIAGSIRFFLNWLRRKPTGHGHRVEKVQYGQPKLDFGDAFGLTSGRSVAHVDSLGMPHVPMRPSYDENIRLAPYPYTPTEGSTTDLR